MGLLCKHRWNSGNMNHVWIHETWMLIMLHDQHWWILDIKCKKENQIANMWNTLTNLAELLNSELCTFFSLLLPASLLRCSLMVSSPEPWASSGGRLPEALFLVFRLESQAAKVCKSCSSRQELSNEYLLSLIKFGFDTPENEPLKVCQRIVRS